MAGYYVHWAFFRKVSFAYFFRIHTLRNKSWNEYGKIWQDIMYTGHSLEK